MAGNGSPGSGPLNVLDPVLSSWDEAIAAVRTRAKWLLGLVAAVAAFIFGTGTLVTRPELSWSDHGLQLLAAAVSATLGLAGLASLAWQVAKVFTPEQASLSDLTDETVAVFNNNNEEYFGPRATGAPPRDQLRQVNQAVLELERTLARLPDEDKTGRKALEGVLRDERARQADIAQGVDALLELDRYHRVLKNRSLSRTAFSLAAFVLVMGVMYQLALSSLPDDEGGDDAGADSSSVQAGTPALLAPPSEGPAAEVWARLGLDACVSNAGPVVVILASGDGSVATPYQAQTVPEAAAGPNCQRQRFTVVEPLWVVTPVPLNVEIEWPQDEDDAAQTTS